MDKQKLIIIVGPTASGKSELAVRLAKIFNGEIISADSRQVYRGLDIGTAKVPGTWQYVKKTKKQKVAYKNDRFYMQPCRNQQVYQKMFIYKNIPHHCIDFVSPKKTYTVIDFKTRAAHTIKEIASRGHIPIIAGGTGFWIDALVEGIELPRVPPNPRLRKKLAQKSIAELMRLLEKKDPERASVIDAKNPHRLIRALEIIEMLGTVPSIQTRNIYNACWIGVSVPQKTLLQHIHTRLLKNLREGMIDEARNLHQKGLPWRRFYEIGLEYRLLADYLRNRISQKELLHSLEKVIIHYAKRQLTWFKRNPDINWTSTQKDAEKLVQQFLA